MRTKIAFYTFGCRLNQAETAILQQGFNPSTYEVVDYRQNPDVVIVNTCTVTENGDADTRRLVNKVRRTNPDVQIALVGCQAQVQKEKLFELPNVRWVVGNARKLNIEKILRESGTDSPQLITPTIQRESFTIPFTGFDHQHTRAILKIQDGCDFFCSFCEIPFARGRARSRVFSDILAEATKLTEAGHQELVLTGINIGTYRYVDKNIVDVLNELETIERLWRIRISSIEPTTIPDDIVNKLVEKGKLCRYLHIPLQSGSDRILQEMQRKYSVSEFAEFIEFVHQKVPEACIGTDVIVGFPGETEKDFAETYNLLLDLPLTYFHVFSYSDRDHAKSRRYKDKVPREIIAQRSQRLRELSRRKRQVYLQRFVGEKDWVLFEQKKKGYWSGLTDTYIRMKVKSDLDLENKLLPVRLEQVDNQTMIGKLI